MTAKSIANTYLYLLKKRMEKPIIADNGFLRIIPMDADPKGWKPIETAADAAKFIGKDAMLKAIGIH